MQEPLLRPEYLPGPASHWLNLPQLYCPFSSTLNPHVEAAHRHTIDWVSRFQLACGEEAQRRFEAGRYAWLSAYLYPTATLELLQLATEWNVWLFVHDDDCDEASIGGRPVELASLHKRMREVIHGTGCAHSGERLLCALRDLIRRMFRAGSAAWRERFLTGIDDYFSAVMREAENRASRRVPEVDDYVRVRPLASPLNTNIGLIELCEDICLPPEVRAHPVVEQLTLLTNHAVCWANDIISLEKEIQYHDVHNLVIVLQQERACTLQEAIALAAAMHDNAVRRFIHLSAQLPLFDAHADAELRRYVGILRGWMRGNLDWALRSGRYGFDLSNAAEIPYGNICL